MKYFSDVTKKLYETQEELISAEFAASEAKKAEEKKVAERKSRNEDFMKKVDELIKLMQDYYDDYGSLPHWFHENDSGRLKFKWFMN